MRAGQPVEAVPTLLFERDQAVVEQDAEVIADRRGDDARLLCQPLAQLRHPPFSSRSPIGRDGGVPSRAMLFVPMRRILLLVLFEFSAFPDPTLRVWVVTVS